MPLYELGTSARAETRRLEEALIVIRQELHVAVAASTGEGQTRDAIDRANAEARALEEEYREILGGQGYLPAALRRVTGALPNRVALTSVSTNADAITVKGMAGDCQLVVEYAAALEKRGEFLEVRIAEIRDPPSAGAGSGDADGAAAVGQSGEVVFTIVASR